MSRAKIQVVVRGKVVGEVPPENVDVGGHDSTARLVGYKDVFARAREEAMRAPLDAWRKALELPWHENSEGGGIFDSWGNYPCSKSATPAQRALVLAAPKMAEALLRTRSRLMDVAENVRAELGAIEEALRAADVPLEPDHE